MSGTVARTGASASGWGFFPDPGTDFSSGDERAIASRLDALAKALHLRIYGISGARSPQHSVAVGGFANDPHTRGQAADIGVNSQLRSSAGAIPEATLRKFGLTRPFGGAAEINHVQLLAGSGSGDFIPWTDPRGQGHSLHGGADAQSGGVAGSLATGPSKVAAEAISALFGALGKDGARILLYIVFTLGGIALAGVGLARATGVRAPKPSTVAKVAALA